jgi:oxygen-independent coproporphyrinogen-3 oxidase
MTPEIVRRMSAPVPRYTSYPTAPHFSSAIGAGVYEHNLKQLARDDVVSLYVHVPFCAELCWYCGCSTKATRNPETISAYAATVEQEIANVRARLGKQHTATHIHWGGGSPNSLSPNDIRRLATALKDNFTTTNETEFAVEIDPRWLTAEQVAAFAEVGVNRASIGVQDFDVRVQAAINRMQSIEQTRDTIEQLRTAGVNGINIDLVYGLPHQTRSSVARTIEEVIRLAPDRIALFGYAHLPSRARHQRMIDERALPDTVERFGQSRRAQRLLTAAGYVAVGLDHFALPHDPLASGRVARNFQGYTTDTANTLIGFGASAISRLPGGYFQNAVPRADYERRIAQEGLATVRGIELSLEDRVRASVIERLMCAFELSRQQLEEIYGNEARDVIDTVMLEADEVVNSDTEGLVKATADGFRLTPRGEPFVRSIAACFDTYLGKSQTLYSQGV